MAVPHLFYAGLSQVGRLAFRNSLMLVGVGKYLMARNLPDLVDPLMTDNVTSKLDLVINFKLLF